MAHLASAPSMPTSSVFQPWGTNAPNVIGRVVMAAFYPRRAGIPHRWRQRTRRKKARTSSTNSAGCSKAAKWPPLSSTFQ